MGMGHRMLPIAFSPTDTRCHDNEIQDKIGYNSACVRDTCEIFLHLCCSFRKRAIKC